jgi:hypothetical protein
MAENNPTTGPAAGPTTITTGNITNAEGVAIGPGAQAYVYKGLSVEQVAVLVAELKRVDQPTVWDGRVPYLGLESFRESDAEFFFGRANLVDELLRRVERSPFVVLSGPSGSGKSSVARAGLFHALRQGRRLPRSKDWLLAALRPAGDPLANLAAAVDRAASRPGAGDHLRQQGAEKADALRESAAVLLSDDPRQRFVLLVDQFEEIFTQTHDEATRLSFINLLTTAAAGDGRTVVLVALRSDFVSNCARYSELREMLNKEFQLVGAMDPPDLAQAITLPALEVGAAIDPALVKQIMDDMRGEPGSLPLMSFALRDLFEAEKTARGKPMDMTLPEYLERGGIGSALERHANAVFATFTAEQQGLARSIFSRLVEIGQGRVDTRRTVAFEDLVPAGTDPALVVATVAELAEQNARLLTTSSAGDDLIPDGLTTATVTLAHEKLIDAWPWLRKLIDENREAIKIQNVIGEDANLWLKNDRDPSFLYLGNRLTAIQDQLRNIDLPLHSLSQEYIDASIVQSRLIEEEKVQAEETERRRLLELAQINRQKYETERRLRNQTKTGLIAVSLIALILLILLATPFLIKQTVKFGRYSETVDIDFNGMRFDAYEVTVDRYAKCVAAGGCQNAPSNFDSVYPGDLRAIYLGWLPNLKNEQWERVRYLPVVEVNAFDAARFCNWIDRRLPTLTEWIIAASHASNISWPPSEESPDTSWANVNSSESLNNSLLPVGTRKDQQGSNLVEGGMEIFDLIGNVWEWTITDHDGKAHLVNLNDAENLMLVGGSFETSVSFLIQQRVTFGANPAIPQHRDLRSGFRCVHDSK